MHNAKSSPFDPRNKDTYRVLRAALLLGSFCFTLLAGSCHGGQSEGSKNTKDPAMKDPPKDTVAKETPPVPPAPPAVLDTALYNRRLRHLANGDSSGRWPVR